MFSHCWNDNWNNWFSYGQAFVWAGFPSIWWHRFSGDVVNFLVSMMTMSSINWRSVSGLVPHNHQSCAKQPSLLMPLYNTVCTMHIIQCIDDLDTPISLLMTRSVDDVEVKGRSPDCIRTWRDSGGGGEVVVCIIQLVTIKLTGV